MEEHGAKPMFYRSESWHASSDPQDVETLILKAFSDKRYAVKTRDDEIQVATGSTALYKIWGNLIPWGQNNAPVGLRLSVRPAPEGGSQVSATVFDRFGWRLTDRTFFGADETFTSKMDHLMHTARTASEG